MITITNVEIARATRRLPPLAERRAIRKRAGVTLEGMANEVGVHRQSVWFWETGQTRPSGVNLIRYVDLLERLRRELDAA